MQVYTRNGIHTKIIICVQDIHVRKTFYTKQKLEIIKMKCVSLKFQAQFSQKFTNIYENILHQIAIQIQNSLLAFKQ